MLYRIPSYSPKFVDAANKKADCYITPWREKFENSILVNESDVIAEKQAYPIPESTSRQQYIRRLEGLIETLNIRGKAKTVISRIISGKTIATGLTWPKICGTHFRILSDICSILRRPAHGLVQLPRKC